MTNNRLALRGVAERRRTMEKDKALDLFGAFERMRATDDQEPLPPIFEVRLDAMSDREDEREFRVRVMGTPWAETSHWREVVLLAQEQEVEASIQNCGIELT